MKYTKLGNSGLIVSKLALGAMTFGSGEFRSFKFNVNQEDANEIVSRSLESGINLFDTADMYASGQSEEILGRALGKRRKDVVVATKVAARMGDAIINAGLSYQHIIASAEASLRRLQTEYIDIYQVHFYDRITPLEEIARALENLVQRGLVRYVGFSNFPAWKAAEMMRIQQNHNYSSFLSTQVYYSLLGRDIEHEIIPFVQYKRLGVLVWSPLAGGFLSGKYTREDPSGGGGRLSHFDFPPVDKEHAYNVVDKVRQIALEHDASCAQVSLAWMLSKPFISSIILGSNSLDQLNDNLNSVDLKLAEQELNDLDRMTIPSPLYPYWMYGAPQDPIIDEVLNEE